MGERDRARGSRQSSAPDRALRALAIALAASLVIGAKPASDFAGATTRKAVAALASRGQLVKIYLFPREVGGPDNVYNVAWVPPDAVPRLQAVTDEVVALYHQGKVNQLDVLPGYMGNSRIPCRIRYIATHKTGPHKLDRVVKIW